jgi:hypothetical protein
MAKVRGVSWCIHPRLQQRINMETSALLGIILAQGKIFVITYGNKSMKRDFFFKAASCSLNPKAHYRVHINPTTGLYPGLDEANSRAFIPFP